MASIETQGPIRVQNQAKQNQVYVLYIVKKGRLEVGLSGRTYVCDPHAVALLPANENLTIKTEEASQVCCIAIPASDLESTLSALLNRPVLRRVSFFPIISRSKPGVEAFLRLVGYLFQECDAEALRGMAPITIQQLEKAFLALLLETLPHSYSGEMLSPSAAPWCVSYCEEHIKAHLDEPLSMADLAAAAKASTRTIHEGFRRHRGYSPMEFVRKLRLERVRAELLDPANSKTVTEVAMDWCFWHLGRFSEAYFKAFGERPSHTLSRVKKTRIATMPGLTKSLIPSGTQPSIAIRSPLYMTAKAGASL